MAINQYFNQTTTVSEQNLVQDLVNEAIQIHGQNFYYIKRTHVNEDTVFNESTLSEFNDAYLLEMYIEDTEVFGGGGDFLTKFGMQINDTLNVMVSFTRFAEEVPDLPAPQEGDLIYWPLQDRAFEINFVEDEAVFWSFGKRYVYRLQTELFDYSFEKFNTGVTEIDDIGSEQEVFTAIDLTMGSGSGDYVVGETVYQGTTFESATSTATVVSWNSGTSVLKVSNLSGEFIQNTNTVGQQSLANYLLGATRVITYTENQTTDNTETYNNFSTEAEGVIDFSVTNPFSEGY